MSFSTHTVKTPVAERHVRAGKLTGSASMSPVNNITSAEIFSTASSHSPRQDTDCLSTRMEGVRAGTDFALNKYLVTLRHTRQYDEGAVCL